MLALVDGSGQMAFPRVQAHSRAAAPLICEQLTISLQMHLGIDHIWRSFGVPQAACSELDTH